jgi:predicted Zn-dependent protease
VAARPAPPPADARSLYLRGRDALARGDTALAGEAFLAAAETLPTWLLPRLELGELALARRENEGPARDALLAFANRGEEGARLYRLVGQLSLDVGDDATGEVYLAKALALRPDQPTLRVQRAGALERLNRSGEAADEYLRALSAGPDDLAMRAVLAGALEAAGRLDEARSQLLELVSRQPGRETPLRRLARYYERRGEAREALEAHRRADRARGTPVPRRNLRPLPPSKR